MSRLLVTGGSGLVGFAVQHALENNHSDVFEATKFLSSKDCNLSDASAVNALFTAFKPTHVIHLAAKVGGLFANQADQIGFLRENLKMNDNIVEACSEFKVKRAIFCLSTCIFPPSAPLPLTESQIHDGPPHASNEGYAMAKRVLECLVRFHRAERGADFITVIPTNLFGPNDNFAPAQSHVLPALILRAHQARLNGAKALEVWGSGTPLRQFLYSLDAGKLIVKLLLKPTLKYTDYILTADDEHTIAQAASAVANAFGFEDGLNLDPSKADGVARKTASNTRVREEFPDFVFADFEESVKSTVEWFKHALSEGKARGV